MITRYTGRRLSRNQITQLTDDKLLELLPGKSAALAGRVSLALIQTLDQAVNLLERDVQKNAGRHSGYQILITIRDPMESGNQALLPAKAGEEPSESMSPKTSTSTYVSNTVADAVGTPVLSDAFKGAASMAMAALTPGDGKRPYWS